MRLLSLFDPFLERSMLLAVVVTAALLFWLFGKRTAVLRTLVQRFPILSASADFIIAPSTVLLLGAFIQRLLAFYVPMDFTDETNGFIFFILLQSIAGCLARIIELFLVSLHDKDEAPYLPGLQRGLLFGGFMFLGLVAFLYLQGYSITGLSISTGAAAALLAFAMQQTLGDLFAGIALSIEHPFKLGERIRLADGSEGKVVDINWRATRLLAWDNSTIVVPNSNLAQQGFTNLHGHERPYAPWYEVKVPADIDPRLARAVLLEAALKCDRVLKFPLPVVRLTDATTVPYTYMVWVHYANYPAMFAGREQLFQEIHYALKGVGTEVSPTINELRTRRATTMQVEPPTTMLALKMLDIAGSLSDEEIERIAEMSVHQTFEAGTVLVAEGEVAQFVDVITHGVVEGSVMTGSGKATVVENLGSGQYFGLTSVVMDSPTFMAFTASTNVTLIRINIACLRHTLANRPDLQDEFAVIMKQRMDRAKDAQLASAQMDKRFTMKDFLRRMEQWGH